MWKVISLLALCVVSSIGQKLVTTVNRCIPDGELCQNHIECCSATCLSFSSKCALDPSYYQPSSLDRDSLQVLVSSLFASTERPANYDSPPTNVIERFDGDDASSTVTTPQNPVTAEAIAPLGDCKIVGMKCFRDSECCTKRCHGFLHQCVT